MNPITRLVVPFLMTLAYSAAFASGPDWEHESATFVHDLDAAQYDMPGGQVRVKAFQALHLRAAELEKQYPERAEPLLWSAWALLGQAGVYRNFSVLGMLNDAKAKLEAAIAIDPKIYNGAPYASLGMWNVSAADYPCFGCKKKAREYLQQALETDPTGIEPNRWYAELLFKEKDYAAALKYATAAVNAPPRPGRNKADQDLRAQADKLITQSREKLH